MKSIHLFVLSLAVLPISAVIMATIFILSNFNYGTVFIIVMLLAVTTTFMLLYFAIKKLYSESQEQKPISQVQAAISVIKIVREKANEEEQNKS